MSFLKSPTVSLSQTGSTGCRLKKDTGTFSPERVSDFISRLVVSTEPAKRYSPVTALIGPNRVRAWKRLLRLQMNLLSPQPHKEDDWVPTEVSSHLPRHRPSLTGQCRMGLHHTGKRCENSAEVSEEPKGGGGGADHKDQDTGMNQTLVLTGYETL